MSGIFGPNVLGSASQPGIGAITWKGDADPALKTLQSNINTVLTRLGYYGVKVDGVLGPATCGAIALLGQKSDAVTDAEWQKLDAAVMAEATSQCQSSTMPTKIAAAPAAPAAPATKPEAASTAAVAPSRGGGAMLWLALGGVAAAAVYFLARKR